MEFSQLSLSAAMAGILAVIFFLYAVLKISGRVVGGGDRKKRLPPEAAGAWPVIGHLHLLSATEPAHITLAKMADAYGPMFTLRFGMNRALIVSSWEIAKECFSTENDKNFASRPKLAAAELLGYDYAMVGLSPYGSHWRSMRKITTLELFTNHRLDQFQPIRIWEVQTSIKKLYDLFVNNSRENGGKNVILVDMKKWFEDITLNTIFRIVVGRRFSRGVEDGNEEFRRALNEFFDWFGVLVPSDSFPFLKGLDLGGYEKAMKKTAKVLDEVFDKWLNEHRQNRNSGDEVETEKPHLMDAMLSSFKDDADQQQFGYDVDTLTKATCLALILAGYETTAITMIWALSLLVNNQEALKKAQLELDEQVGRQRQVKESDVKNLIYLQAIVKETLRLYPAGPLLVPHESMEDCMVAGYHIPARTRLLVNVQKLQRDPLVWENPCEFRPERFLTSQKDIDFRGQNPQFIPFGSGRRMCPGVSFALQIMHLTLANLLQGFEIDRPSKELLDMEESVGMANKRKGPLELILTPRLQIQVYDSF